MEKKLIVKKLLLALPVVFMLIFVCLPLFDKSAYEYSGNSGVINKQYDTQITLNVYQEIISHLSSPNENVFCFPSVPELADSNSEDESSDISIDECQENILTNWVDFEHYTQNTGNGADSDLDDGKMSESYIDIEEILPDYLLMNSSTSFDNTVYKELFDDLIQMGYSYDYQKIGLISDSESTPFELWVKCSEKKSSIFTEKKGTSSNPYVLNSTSDLLEFAAKVDNGWDFNGKNIILNKDIDLNNRSWEPIGDYEKGFAFCGIFNGNGHIISNLNIKEQDKLKYAGLFDYMNGLIYNLGINNGSFYGETSCSFVANSTSFDSYILNCYSNLDINGKYCGAFAGYFSGKIDFCYYNGQINAESKQSLAFNSGNLRLVDCFVDKKIAVHNNMERVDSAFFNNYLVDSDFFATQEFVDALNENIINKDFFNLKLLSYELNQENNLVRHSSQWTYELSTNDIYVTSLLDNNRNADDNTNRSFTTVKKDHIQYGPYVDLSAGKYKVVYQGKNVSNGTFDVYSKSQKKTFAITTIQRSGDTVEYIVDVPYFVGDIEFRMKNNHDQDIEIYKISVSSIE